MEKINRRDFIKSTASAAVAASLATQATGAVKVEGSSQPVRIGIVGTGNRGRSLLNDLLKNETVKIPALCDIDRNALAAAQTILQNTGHNKSEEYYKDEYSFKKLMERDDLDAVIIATPWHWHTPMAVYSMKAGKYTAVEVPAAITFEQCWDLVNTSEQTGIPCMMLENWSFRQDNLAVLNMIRKGLLGQIVHCHCAHSHDCIDHWFFENQTGKDRWGAEYLLKYNRSQYPTHSLGPVLSWMDIGCGDYFDYMTTVATDCFGINDMFVRRFGPDHPGAKRKYAQGDITTSLVRTKKGKSIVINYDMQLPRPYDNRWMIQGTRGIYSEARESVYIVDKSPQYHEWESFGPYQAKYQHSWAQYAAGGHGGTDYLELKLFTDAVRNKTQTPLDVYDSVLMSSIIPLSEESIKQNGAPVTVPDFTRGKWKTKKPYFALEI
jgi:predicted dehydrogenase